MNGDVSDFFELFMIPGMDLFVSRVERFFDDPKFPHIEVDLSRRRLLRPASNYPAVPATYHTVERLIEWVEKGVRPKDILSTDTLDGRKRTRKLCPWP